MFHSSPLRWEMHEGFHRVCESMCLEIEGGSNFQIHWLIPLSQLGVIKCLPTSLLFCVEMGQTFMASPGSWFFSPWLPFKVTTVVSLWCYDSYDFQIYRTSNIFISEMTPFLKRCKNPPPEPSVIRKYWGKEKEGPGRIGSRVPVIQDFCGKHCWYQMES